MPIPKPTPKETEKEYLKRCMADPTMYQNIKVQIKDMLFVEVNITINSCLLTICSLY